MSCQHYNIEDLFKLADEEFSNGWKLTNLDFIILSREKVKCVGTFASKRTTLFGIGERKIPLPLCSISKMQPLLEEIKIWEVQQFFGTKYGNILFDKAMYNDIKKSLAINYTTCGQSIQVTMYHDIGQLIIWRRV